ncbi:DUF5723 family protein [Maribacter hydrothermalis]|uniref:DUF5723 domain-containing protein n=1 Tax=Maribacter hydrothermalis TaxID=1836467 RepID=A0A1B7ZC28_9FLAO|nr:DUF5723 family protein [Maribacter hydrothermalis]APQ17932.1 hypothetical protein BTR34_11605 [Maribacter hydrothermalis]OBR40474.1 hypothetical protein A9200_15260 [Maribacter hydrothermalis]
MKLTHYLFMGSLLLTIGAFSQNKQLLYDFNEIPQSLTINPGVETDFKWYAGVPLLSGVHGYAGSNGISVNDIFASDGVDINIKFRERGLNNLTPRDEFSSTVQLEYLNGGFRLNNPTIFYSFGGYMELDNIGYWPQDYAFLVFDGNADQLDRKFDLGDLKARGSLINVMHFGINKKVDRNLTIGARGKIYSGIVDYSSTSNNGYLRNTAGVNNRIATTLDADLKLRTSGFQALDEANDSDTATNEIVKRAFFGGDLGLGIDVGFTYHLSERTMLTGSLIDLGFIYHTSDPKTYSLNGKATVEGIQIDVLEDFANLNRDFWQDLVDDVETLVPFDTDTNSYLTFRPTKLYASIRNDFGEPVGNSGGQLNCDCTAGSMAGSELRTKYRNSVGAQVFMINRPRGPQMALTGFYTRRIGNFLAFKGTYTVDKFSYTNIGLGMNLQAGPVNFHIMADNLLSYQNIADTNYASFQLGLNIISWGRNK